MIRPPTKTEVRILTGPDEVPEGAVLIYGPEEGQKLLAELELHRFNTGEGYGRGSLAHAVVDAVAQSTPWVATALQAGQIFEIVGSTVVLEGLQSGTLSLMQSQGQLLGAAVSTTTGRIAGQSRFVEVSSIRLVGPSLFLQALHVVAGTIQLAAINKKLDELHHQVEKLARRLEAGVVGSFYWAVDVLDDILGEMRSTGRISQVSQSRLVAIEGQIGPSFHRNRILVDNFRHSIDQVKKLRGKKGQIAAEELATKEGRQALSDMELLVALAAVDLRIQQTYLQIQLEDSPNDVGRRMQRLIERMEGHQQMLADLPSVEGLVEHARECANDIGRWRLFARWGAGKRQGRVDGLNLQDVEVQERRDDHSRAPRVLFHLDASGRAQATLLDPTEIKLKS